MSWEGTDFPGVTYKPHLTRKHGRQYDKYFRGQYQVGKKRRTIGFGWSSEGWTAKNVFQELEKFKRNAKMGLAPTTLKEQRELAEQRKLKEKAERKRIESLNVRFDWFFDKVYLPTQSEKMESSLKREIGLFNNWLKPNLGHKRLSDISGDNLENLKRKLFEKGQSKRSTQYTLAVVRQVFNKAISLGYVEQNPIKTISIPKKLNNQRIRHLSLDEANSLLDKISKISKKVHDISLLSLHTGMRAGEIFNLTANNLDFVDGTIQIKDPKNNIGRVVYMTQAVMKILEDRAEQNTAKLVFPGRKGYKMKYISKTFYTAVNDLGLNKNIQDRRDRVCFHTLRHTFASWQVQSGMPLYTLQKLLGHESYAMVSRYAHLAPENLQIATKIFDEQIAPTN